VITVFARHRRSYVCELRGAVLVVASSGWPLGQPRRRQLRDPEPVRI